MPIRAMQLRWRVLVHPALPGAENMAWDHTLTEDLPPDTGVLRFYTWARPTLSLGRNEPARGRFDPERLEDQDVAVVRRPTGGRAVLHHRELTYAVCAPIRALGGVRAAYVLVNRALAAGLEAVGATVGVAGPGPVRRPDAGPCFQAPAEGEVTAGGRKLVGSAQVRMGATLLQHGSVLLADDQSRIRDLAGEAADVGEGRPASLGEILPEPISLSELRRSLVAGCRRHLPGDWRGSSAESSFARHDLPSSPRPDLLEQYASPAWTWRR